MIRFRMWRIGVVHDCGSLLNGDGMLALRQLEQKITGRQIIRAGDWTGSEFGAGWRLVWLPRVTARYV